MAVLQNNQYIKKSNIRYSIILVSLLLLIILLGKTAWLCDDAMITFRTVLQFTHGNGLVFNLGDRVQGYTHPLWMLVLTFNYWINQEIFISTMHLGIVLTAIAFSIVVFQARHHIINLSLICLGLVGSKAFIEYGTSGLENPLSYVLFGILFVLVSQQKKQKLAPYVAIITTCSLIFLCRMDYAVICAPISIIASIQVKKIKYIIQGFFLGGLPAFAWLIFSTVYYGTPFPNTYYAKLYTGIPKYQSIIQGFHYFQDLVNNDLLSFVFIFLTLITLIFQKNTKIHVGGFAIGLLLYLLYILNIGGDFMSGRFFAVPVYLAAIVISQVNIQRKLVLFPIGVLVFILMILNIWSLVNIPQPGVQGNGIANERGFYYEKFGLYSPFQEFPDISSRWSAEQQQGAPSLQLVNIICGGLGNESLRAGPNVHFVDTCGLVDALLVRLPSQVVGENLQAPKTVFSFMKLVYNALFESLPVSWVNEFGWRIGHVERAIPKGYIESIQQGENRIEDEAIAHLYDQIKQVISGPIWSLERFKLVWKVMINP
ncbi:hypothetical protein PN441_00740 [Spirulina major CS-329]|uniref:hypothetical protein n=1 Tax=Spirulina TaxID=1154 RepID=UPI00232F6BC1|nr:MULTISPECIES: hypothetical protein [Spirulina]MDB9494453.1 hypothetical protein [Spirulina subsalsa CS-330]MDB9501580.1 hypothetical protein [Spirulina major CS-329]